jgi:CDGSH iron-sulfur domain-containing protein 3
MDNPTATPPAPPPPPPHPVDMQTHPDGFLVRDNRIRVLGYKEPPPAELVEAHCAGYGSIKLTLTPGKYSWCSCGYSKNQPFCDDSHRDEQYCTNRRSYKFEVLEEITVSLCACKQTKNPPFCDSTHKTLVKPEDQA